MPRPNNKPLGVLSGIAGLVSFSVLAGVLVTALVTPALAVTSMTANASISVFEGLPEYMEIGALSQKNVMWAKRGGKYVQFAEVYKHNREEVSWDQVSPYIKNALVAGEDRRFYEHGGVDIQSIVRAAIGNLSSNEIGSGASTLAMQLVKNINIQEALLLPDKAARDKAIADAQAKTLDRKLQEAKFAIGLEKNYTKNQIMLAYLNITGFGGNTYGIQAAAKEYLGKSAIDVTPAEAASLIAIVQLPNDRNLDKPEKYPANQKRRDFILGNMLELNMLTQEQYTEAINTPVEDYVHYSYPTSGCTYAADAKTFCDYILKSVKDFTMLGNSEAERQANWDRGGYNVYTTLDLDQQDNAQKQLSTYAPSSENRFKLGATVSAVQVGTGRILVMAQNKGFDDTGQGDKVKTTAVNFNTDRAYGGSSGFPAASTYKLFTLTDWLLNGHGVNEVLNATPQVWTYFKASCVSGGGYYGPYRSANDAGESGPWSVLRGTARSVNGIFLSMASQLDLCDIANVAKSMGVHRADGEPLLTLPSSVLGVNEVAPMTMASAIATVGGGGVYCAPIAVDKMVDANGNDLGGQKSDCHQAIPKDVAAGAAYALKAVMDGGGTGYASNPRNGTPLIGKSGTDDHAWHTWVISSSTKVAMAVWVGNIVGHQSLRSISVAGTFGALIRHRIGLGVLGPLTREYGGSAFPAPPASMLHGVTIPIPSVAGQDPEAAKTLLESLGFTVTIGGKKASSFPVGTVATTDPPPGTKVSKGYNITIFTSDGTLYVDMPTDLPGQHLNSAVDELVALGFKKNNISYTWVMVQNPGEFCKVIDSDPAGGAPASKNDPVTLTVGSDADGTPPPGCTP
ncbi:membrane peptidoglycan carboxypeptidase [Cryobacterium mesophilum]|uniref:PASTA domain-containing protein n=1 Tax=Terrimesophilobacter mesophilus TaxID=433647 RepID=A0A4R8VAL4_9MICO|nr:transglycosylase domain-containing protein [Terrimesophilobacter mesophilus]MBB5633540.1 membrane peptidoglycan carboxypeptidase [Terrimesophilobacter mesophilus]TFB80244.1 PASTA domain-containing protein [Terrimesophilobacter mesophilus]